MINNMAGVFIVTGAGRGLGASIDGLIDNERTRRLNPERTQDKYLSMDSIAQEVIRVALQSRDCWTFEWDVRPFNETF